MWKKMTRQGGGVDSVYDAVALRAVIKAKRLSGESDQALEERSKQLCYHVSFIVLYCSKEIGSNFCSVARKSAPPNCRYCVMGNTANETPAARRGRVEG